MYNYITRKRGLYAGYSIFTLLASLGGIIYAFVISELLDRAVDKDAKGLMSALVLSVVFVAAAVLCEYIYGVLANRLLFHARRGLKDELFRAFLGKSYETADTDNSGEYINELTNNVDTFAMMYFNNIIQLPIVVLTFVIAVVICIVIEPVMLMVIVAFSLLIALVSNKCGNILNESTGAYAAGMGKYMSVLKDYFGGLRILRGYGRTEAIAERHADENKTVEKLKLKNENDIVMYGRINELLGLVSTLTIMSIAGIFAIKGVFSIGIVLAHSQE